MSGNSDGVRIGSILVVLPLQLILAALSGWLEREQRDVINFLREENRVLKAQLRGRRVRLTDDQRRRLAVLGRLIGRRTLRHISTLVTPDTILRWHCELVARKWTRQRRRVGRPGVQGQIRALVPCNCFLAHPTTRRARIAVTTSPSITDTSAIGDISPSLHAPSVLLEGDQN